MSDFDDTPRDAEPHIAATQYRPTAAQQAQSDAAERIYNEEMAEWNKKYATAPSVDVERATVVAVPVVVAVEASEPEPRPIHPIAAADTLDDLKIAALNEARAMRADPINDGVSDYELELRLSKLLSECHRPWTWGVWKTPPTMDSPGVRAPGYDAIDFAKEALAHAGKTGATPSKYGRPPRLLSSFDKLKAKMAAKDVDPHARLVAFALFYYAGATTLEAWPTAETLASDTGLFVDTIYRILKRLRKAEIIEVVMAGGGRSATRYRFKL